MADREKALVEKVELRLALADSDAKFEHSLGIYLAPLLLKFASPHAAVKSQVGKTVQFLLSRINSSPTIQLPTDALLKQVQLPQIPEGENPIIVQSYTLVFLSKGISRLSQEDRNRLIPKVIEGISGFKSVISARLFNILCKLILNYDTSEINVDNGKKFREFMQFDGVNRAQEDYLIDKFYKFSLLQSIHSDSEGRIPKGFSFPGLSNEDCTFFTYDAGITFDSATLSKYKVAILKFIQYGFNERNTLVFFTASADTSSAVADLASNLLRRRSINHEDPYLVDSLISMFLGDPQTSRSAVRVQLQEKIMNFLCQSERAVKDPSVDKLMSIGLDSQYSKLKRGTVKFIRWVITQLSASGIEDNNDLNSSMALQLMSNLQKDKQAEVNTNMSDYLLQRRYQYEALGLILRRSSQITDFSFIDFLFDMVLTEIPELRPSAQDALSGLTVHLPNLESSSKEKLKQFLKGIIQSEINQRPVKRENELAARYMAVKFINCAFPFSDPEARLLNIQAQSKDDKPETIEEASKGLNPYWFSLLQSSNSKEFKSTEELVGRKLRKDIKFPEFDSMVKYMATERMGQNLDKAIIFTLRCLVMESVENMKTVIVIDSEWEERIENAIDFDHHVRNCIVRKLASLNNVTDVDSDGDTSMHSSECSLDIFLKLCFEQFSSTINLEVGKRLAMLISLCPSSTISRFVSEVDSLLEILGKTFSDDASCYISEMLGILCSHVSCSDESVLSIVDKLLDTEEIRPLGFIISRLALTKRLSLVDPTRFEKILDLATTYQSSSGKFRASFDCISQLSLFGCLGPTHMLTSKLSDYRVAIIDHFRPLVKKLQDDRTAMTWAHLRLSEASSEEANEGNELMMFEQTLYDAHTTKHSDYLFSLGEAFTVVAYGWRSHIMDDKVDIQQAAVKVAELVPDIDRVRIVLSAILKACESTKPSLRKAACIWLLSMVQYCGDSPSIKSKLSEIQVAFMRFLTDSEDLIQESASRGLSIVYERGDYDLKDELAHNLLLSFTDSNRTSKLISGSIGGDTKLFEPGVLKTDEGSVSTYKDILNLASEVGDPSLVYRFMSLAKNSALWSSRKGIAYGLGAVLDKSKLDEMLRKDESLSSKLIPKLYRYRFDPSKSVSKTMDDIWSALILDSNKTIADNFEIIFKDLLKGMGNREWRVREASAAALNDLLRHFPLTRYEDKLSDIWAMAFRSMDDIKESVRKEGNLLTRYLATTMVKRVSQQGKSSEESLKQLIPFLLGNNGLLSDADDVKSFAFDTILKIAETSSSSLKPFVNEMIEHMISVMSSVEPQAVNYLSLNADKYKLKTQDIDMQRLNMVGGSPMMGAIEKLMNLLDASLMPDFVERLSNAVKNAVGLPSKVTGSKVIVDLIVKHFFLAQEYGNDLLKISMSQLKNHNDTVSGSYAIATGYCIRIAPTKKIRTLSNKLKRYYFEAPSDNNYLQKVSSRTCAAAAKYSKDTFQSVASDFLPLAYIGRHDLDDKVSDGFKKAWDASIGSGSNAIKLYFKEILGLIKSNIDTANFGLRHTIGLSVIEIVDRLGSQVGTLSQYLDDFYKVLLDSLHGRTYEGKEKLLDSLVLLAVNNKDYLEEHEDNYEKVRKCIITEAKRKNKSYRKHSIKSFGKFLGTYAEDSEMYSTYIELIDSLLHPSKYETTDGDSDNDSMDTDSDSDRSGSKKMRAAKLEEFRNSLLENLIIAVNKTEPNFQLVRYILDDNLSSIASEVNSFKTKLVIMNILTELINKLDHSDGFKGQQGKELAQKCLTVWNELTKSSSSSDNLQSVLVSYIRLTKLVATTLSPQIDEDVVNKATSILDTLAKEKINSVITMEAERTLKKLKNSPGNI
ncbi:hypothetical protein FOA43_000540 [Brettanomyces nanus]|uniref:Proteasome component ECM29 n=1 Tax=Eeniella nana TaxID=13502 RepID=A0A875RXF7_EENNA|nr:uncharacterized protein FOA43_000540 [Brettanomyces nanus]QPG73233.1 hypothetical protein FOA43_000540 [Brettanomyces nanus]